MDTVTLGELLLLAVASALVGFSKTAISGANTVSLAVFAAVLPARESTGVILPLLIAGDVLAVLAYRRHAHWPTLLRLLLGHLAPDEGRASLGASVAVGEIDQARTSLAEALPLGDAFEAAVPAMTPAEVRTLLAKFGLKADQVGSLVHRLSPGERTRAAMALLQARGVNLLVLDEPTNHLDLPAIEQLEQALAT